MKQPKISKDSLAKMIDHSLLKPTITYEDVKKGCELALTYNVASICVKPCHVKLASKLLKKSSVKTGTVIGFPHGSNTTETKVAEAKQAIADGAEELDMVCNIGAVKSNDWKLVEEDIKAVVNSAEKTIVKLILETCYLTEDEKVKVCQLAEKAGADFVKTSTGFGTAGATIEDIKLMRKSVSDKVGVKAAGGIRSLDKALEVIEAGATRIGATATEKIMNQWQDRYGENCERYSD